MTTPETNKQSAMGFYDLMFNRSRPREAIERYAGDEYIQHNPHVGDGKDAFVSTSSGCRPSIPASASSSSERSRRATWSSCTCFQQWPGDHDHAGIDIFRFDGDGKIVEHWDVLQTIPAESRNDNGMF